MRNDSGAKIQKVELKINPQIANDFIALSPFSRLLVNCLQKSAVEVCCGLS